MLHWVLFHSLSSVKTFSSSKAHPGITKAGATKRSTSPASNISQNRWNWRRRWNWRTSSRNLASRRKSTTTVKWYSKTTFLSRRTCIIGKWSPSWTDWRTRRRVRSRGKRIRTRRCWSRAEGGIEVMDYCLLEYIQNGILSQIKVLHF